jgi:hypothetical protein
LRWSRGWLGGLRERERGWEREWKKLGQQVVVVVAVAVALRLLVALGIRGKGRPSWLRWMRR